MASNIDEVTINYEEDGVLIVKELDKVLLSKGSWSTVLYRYVQWEKAKNDYGPHRYSIRRYRKVDDEYRQQAKFNISSRDQALKLIAALGNWVNEEGVAEIDAKDEEEPIKDVEVKEKKVRAKKAV